MLVTFQQRIYPEWIGDRWCASLKNGSPEECQAIREVVQPDRKVSLSYLLAKRSNALLAEYCESSGCVLVEFPDARPVDLLPFVDHMNRQLEYLHLYRLMKVS